MFGCLRASTLKLVRDYPFSTRVTTISYVRSVDCRWERREHPGTPRRRLVHTTDRGRWAISTDFGKMGAQAVAIMSEVKMESLTEAPEAAFWSGVAGSLPLLAPPVTFLLVGYSPVLTTAQLAFAAGLCSFFSGTRWGLGLGTGEAVAAAAGPKAGEAAAAGVAAPKVVVPPGGGDRALTWEGLSSGSLAQAGGLLGLVLPQSLGFLVVAATLGYTALTDLPKIAYPRWFKALRLALTLAAITGLLWSFLVHLFFG